MTASLDRFFAEMAPMLASRRSAAEVEGVLGASPSGTTNLGFYAELVRRNLEKILRDVFGHTRALALRGGHERWRALVEGYTAAHPPAGNVPNRFAAAFPGWLANQGDDLLQWSEIADFEWLRVRAHHAVDGDGDGLDRRMFIRQYTFDVPRWIASYAEDPAAPLPRATPCIAVVFRHHATGRVGVHRPTAAGLAAIARRAGASLPPELAELDLEAITRAEQVLVTSGVLVPIQGDQP